MKTSTLFAFAMVAFSQFSTATAAVAPTKVIARTPQDTTEQKGKQSPSVFPVPDTPTSQGCYSADGNYTINKSVENLSSGSCYESCKAKKFNVMALHGGQCVCGDFYPPKKSLTKDTKCNFPCPYFPEEACGGLGSPGYWSVFNTGLDVNVENLPEPKDDDKDKDDDKTTAASSSTAAAATSSTAAATAPAATTSDAGSGEEDGGEEEEKKGPNTAGIAAGVVVGVVAVAAGIGGLFFWMRRKRNAEIEEDHRRNAAVNAFINGSKPPSSHGSISMTDSRLDPVLAHRRMSDGSIADNQDYSRRILRVTNA